MSNNPCPTCLAGGLPILPSRYTVVPADIPLPGPDPLGSFSGERVKDVAINANNYRYAVRTLRKGFLYVFFEKGALGANYWEAYTVTENGELWKADSAQAVQSATRKACSSQGHNALRLQYFVIEQPEHCGKVWVAYSEHKWGEKTLERYEGAEARASRMQMIEPAKWISASESTLHRQILATGSNLKTVLEYRSELVLIDGEPVVLPHNGPPTPPRLSNPDGTHVESVLRQQTTKHPWHMRNTAEGEDRDKVLETLVDQMVDKCGDPTMGVSYWPMGLALWDAIGLTEELNGYYNDALGALARYGDERALQISAIANIRGAKTALESGAADRADRSIENVREGIRIGDRGQDIRARNAVIEAYFPPEGRMQMALLERRRAAGEIDQATYLRERQQIFDQHLPADKHGEAGNAFDVFHTKMEEQRGELDGRLEDYRRNEIAAAWPRYDNRIDWDKITAFERQYEVFQRTAVQLADARARDLIKWLDSPLLLDTLEDYHPAEPSDGLDFAEVVADLIDGLAGCDAGDAYLTTLVQSRTDPTQRQALFWRAISANQDAVKAEMKEALSQAVAGKNTGLDIGAGLNTAVAALNKMKEFVGYYKDGASAALGKNPDTLNMRARLFKNLGVDKLLLTCGDKVFSWLRINSAADYVGEKMIQNFFLVRAGVSNHDAIALVRLQAQFEGLSRTESVARMRTAKTFLEANEAIARQRSTMALTEAWTRIRPADSRLSTTQMRIGIVVGLVDVVNLTKTLAAADKTKKEYFQIVASIASLSSAVIGIVVLPYELLGKKSHGFQLWKLRGAAFSQVASIIGLGMDWASADKAMEENKIAVGILYYVKVSLGAMTSIAGVISAVATSGPLIKRIGQRSGIQILVFVGGRVPAWAAAGAVARVLGVLVGWKIAIVVGCIQILIWYFTPNDLEEWCETCAFGRQRTGKPHTDSKVQEEKFVAALQSVS